MSPRSNRPRRGGRRAPAGPGPGFVPSRLDAGPQREQVHGRTFIVRPVRGNQDRSYRCPGCDQMIPTQTPHLVVWPDDLILGSGVEERRHWHSSCWRRRVTSFR